MKPENRSISEASLPEQRIMRLWRKFGHHAFGRRLFHFLFNRAVPYSATIGSQIVKLEPGHALLELRDRRKVRNHLNSIHAIALANLGELASGLAMIAALPPHTRAIVVRLEINYLKKARGTLLAEGRASPPERILESISSIAEATIRDNEHDEVATVRVEWRLSPQEARTQ